MNKFERMWYPGGPST